MHIVATVLLVGVTLVKGQDNGFAEGVNPWDCQVADDGTPTADCIERFPMEWFPTRADIDGRCNRPGNGGDSSNPDPSKSFNGGCLLVASPFANTGLGYTAAVADGTSFGSEVAFCGTTDSLQTGAVFEVGVDIVMERGTPSDPFGRCSRIDEIFGAQDSSKPEQMFVWCGEPDLEPVPTTPDPSLCKCDETNSGPDGGPGEGCEKGKKM